MADQRPPPDAAANNGGGDAAQPPPANDAEINAGAAFNPRIPLPTLRENCAEAYFMSLEFWFAACGQASDARKYHTVLAQIPLEKLPELSTVIAATPPAGKYDYIKTALIRHFAESQSRRLQRVLSEMPLGDKKPSQLYHDMARVAGNALGETALRDLWAQRLPPFTQTAVVASNGTLAECLATADRVNETVGRRHNQVTNVETESSNNAELTRVARQVDELCRRFNEKFSQSNHQSRSRNHSRSRSQNRNNSGQRNDQASGADPSGLCWYHAEHGRKAKKCREPCIWARPTSTSAAATSTPPPNANQN